MMRSDPSSRGVIIALVLVTLAVGLVPTLVRAQADPPAVVRAEYLENVPLGDTVILSIALDSIGALPDLSGFDLLIQYDPAGMTFISADPGTLPGGCGWEYFNYRSDTVGLVRLVAVADINNGDVHPSCYLDSAGNLAELHFLVTSNPDWANYYLPLFFYWADCGDNAFATSAGDTLLISNRVFSIEGIEMTANDPMPNLTGAPSECLTGAPNLVIRGVNYYQGGILISGDTVVGPARIALDSDNEAFIGEAVNLGIRFVPGPFAPQLGGFDLLLRYDQAFLEFTGAAPGLLPDTCAWEYFTYGTDTVDTETLIRIVAVADLNDANTPLCYAQEPGTLANLSFVVPSDTALLGVTSELEWFWADCGDNVLADRTGDTLFMSHDVFTTDGFPITADSAFPTIHGTPDSCLGGGAGTTVRSVDFYSGRVRIPAGQNVDYRGDLNVNGVPNELADYLLFVDYFRFGAGVFAIDSALQIATSDVNADGLVLTLEDLIFLYEITRGTEQAEDYHFAGYDTVDFHQDAVGKTISYTGVDSLAAFILTFQGAVTPTLTNASAGTLMWSEYNGTQTRVVVYPGYSDSLDLWPGIYPETFLTYTGDGTLQSAVAGDYLQQILVARVFGTSADTTLPTFAIGIDDYVFLGDTVQIAIDLTDVPTGFEMAGFNFSIQFDPGPLTLLDIQPGQLLQECGWEIFDWHMATPAECDSGCPDGLVKVISLAESAGIPGSPSCYADLDGQVAVMTFVVSDSDLYNCELANIQWRWYDCSDNALASRQGELIWPATVYNAFGGALTPAVSFPNSSGLIASCSPGIPRDFNLRHGMIAIMCVDPVDERGDVNLNGIAYEIADYVMYSNYLLYGLSAFFEPAAQTANSDVNADGTPLTLDDFVYLYRVAVGEALPFPRPPTTPAATATVTQDGTTSTVRIQYPGNITTAWFIFGGEVDATCAFATHVATAVYDSAGYTRVLVTAVNPFDSLVDFPPMDTSRAIIGYTGEGTLLHAEVASDGLEVIPVSLSYNNVPSCCQQRGNVNGAGGINVADLTALVGYLFQGAFPPPPCPDEADVDASGGSSPITVSDITYLVNFLFQGGAVPGACP